jgi:hypothetical protein
VKAVARVGGWTGERGKRVETAKKPPAQHRSTPWGLPWFVPGNGDCRWIHGENFPTEENGILVSLAKKIPQKIPQIF